MKRCVQRQASCPYVSLDVLKPLWSSSCSVVCVVSYFLDMSRGPGGKLTMMYRNSVSMEFSWKDNPITFSHVSVTWPDLGGLVEISVCALYRSGRQARTGTCNGATYAVVAKPTNFTNNINESYVFKGQIQFCCYVVLVKYWRKNMHN